MPRGGESAVSIPLTGVRGRRTPGAPLRDRFVGGRTPDGPPAQPAPPLFAITLSVVGGVLLMVFVAAAAPNDHTLLALLHNTGGHGWTR